MATTDWDWQGELATCKKRIFDFEVQIEVHKLEINRLLKDGRDTAIVAHTLTITRGNLKHAQEQKRFIETKMAGDAGRGNPA